MFGAFEKEKRHPTSATSPSAPVTSVGTNIPGDRHT